jgi:hypothetical protein
VVEAVPAPDHAQSSPFDLLSRDDLRAAFSLSDSPKAQRFLACLSSPKYKHWNVATIARRCGVSIGEVFTLWRNGQFLVAMFAMLKAVPEIAGRMAEDAAGRTLVCPGCRGMGTIKGREDLACPQCRGTGAVNVPDSEARKLLFEIVGFTGKNLVRLDHGAPNNMGCLESILDGLERIERDPSIEAEFEKT